jgi:predicted dinucleotide-binding enzyme
MSRKIAIVGGGKVGSALRQGLERAGHEVKVAARGQVASTAAWAEFIVLAVPYAAVKDVARELATAADQKTVVDVTNALAPDMSLAVGFSTSGAEELQKILPQAYVVKAFNTMFAAHMAGGGQVGGQQLSVFGAGDHESARKSVLDLGKSLGFDAIDAGPLKNARHLEAMAALNIQLGFVLGYGANVGFKFVH